MYVCTNDMNINNMILKTKHYGGNGHHSSSIIELIVENKGTVMSTDVVDANGKVSEELIESLRDIADELENNNNLFNQEQQR